MNGLASPREGLGLNLTVTPIVRTSPPAYQSFTTLGGQIAALSETWRKVDALTCAGATLADNVTFQAAQQTIKAELLAEIEALINLDQAQLAYLSQLSTYVNSLTTQNAQLRALTQGGGPPAPTPPGPPPTSAPTTTTPAAAPTSGVSGSACGAIALLSAVVGGSIGFGIGRKTSKTKR